MLGAVDQGIQATRMEHALYRITLPIDKRQLNRVVQNSKFWNTLKHRFRGGAACLVVVNQNIDIQDSPS
jgi:hypothetical protein